MGRLWPDTEYAEALLTFTNFSFVLVGSQEKTSLVQQPPHRTALVHVGQIEISGSWSLGNAIVMFLGLQASYKANSPPLSRNAVRQEKIKGMNNSPNFI